MVYTQVVYITYNMGNQDLPDIYADALGPAALGLGHIYQANPSCPCYNLYICIMLRLRVPIAPQDYMPHAKTFGNYIRMFFKF